MTAPRKIIHVDMDAFYAAVEQRDDPRLRGKPVIVGGSPRSRGVVCTASYEARKFGVRSAISCAQAYRLCPDGIFVPPDFPRYAAVAADVRGVFDRYTDLVEPLSLDEAYLDVTENRRGLPSATWVAEEIRAAIRRETGLTASAGVSSTKFIAKVASDVNKPDGLCVVPPGRVHDFLRDLPVRRIPGIGKVTEARCHDHGIRTCGDLLRYDLATLAAWFGSSGQWFYDLARGIDPRPVLAERIRRSCGIEDTFAADVTDLDEVGRILGDLAARLETRLSDVGVTGRTVTLKVKYADFRLITRSRSLETFVSKASVLAAVARALLAETEAGTRPVRLLGITVSHLDTEADEIQHVLPFCRELEAAWALDLAEGS